MLKKILTFTCAVALASNAFSAKRLHSERYYQEQYCTGEVEYKLPDNTRVDCLTDEYAVEYDFAGKHFEAVGQSLHYARMTGKKAAIALIIENESDRRFFDILSDNINHYKLPITIFIIK